MHGDAAMRLQCGRGGVIWHVTESTPCGLPCGIGTGIVRDGHQFAGRKADDARALGMAGPWRRCL
jgi:hypothetical protein